MAFYKTFLCPKFHSYSMPSQLEDVSIFIKTANQHHPFNKQTVCLGTIALLLPLLINIHHEAGPPSSFHVVIVKNCTCAVCRSLLAFLAGTAVVSKVKLTNQGSLRYNQQISLACAGKVTCAIGYI